MNGPLTLADITDAVAYERERPSFLAEVIGLKALRRIGVGPLLSVVFENRTTIRFQIQEMARAEKMTTDEQIQTELDIYNPLVPAKGELSMTLFVELTSKQDLEMWLAKLSGIERSIRLVVGDDPKTEIVAELDPGHAEQLTRPEVTASVHYLKAQVPSALIERFAELEVTLGAFHEAYHHETALSDETKASLASDWKAS